MNLKGGIWFVFFWESALSRIWQSVKNDNKFSCVSVFFVPAFEISNVDWFLYIGRKIVFMQKKKKEASIRHVIK